MSKLVLHGTSGADREILLDRERITIGRKAHNDIHLDGAAVSGEHAVIITLGSDSFLEDLHSTNGTQVNQATVHKCVLRDGDEIGIASYRFTFVSEPAVQSAPGACRTYGDRSATILAGKPQSGCSQNSAGRGQILPVLQVNSHSIDQKSGEIWTAQADSQPIHHKSDRLLGKTISATSKQWVDPRAAHPTTLMDAVTLMPEFAAPDMPGESFRNTSNMADSRIAPGDGTLGVIRILAGPGANQRLELSKPVTTLGKPGIQVVAISLRDGRYCLGVVEGETLPLVNGSEVKELPYLLQPQDIISIAGIQLEFTLV
jgi:hypothetical protein